MNKEEIASRVGQEIRSCHPYAFRSGTWALIKSVSKHSGGDDMWLLEWPDGVTDIWVPWDEVAQYEFRSTDPLVRLLDEELGGDPYVAEHLAEVLREAGLIKGAPKGVTVEDLDYAPLGARAITADERVIEKTPEGWVIIGWMSTMSVRPDYEKVSSDTAMNLSPLYMIGERERE